MPFPYVKQTWTDGVSSCSAARNTVHEDGIALAGVYGIASTPPGTPVDGMIWRFPAQTGNGVWWEFMYDSAQTTYKWTLVGGPPMYIQSATDGTVASATYVDPTTAPSMTLTMARAGIYEADWNALVQIATSDILISAALKVGAAATSDDNAGTVLTPNASGRLLTVTGSTIVTAAAADVLKVQYKNTSGTVDIRQQRLRIRAVQVI